MGSIGAAAASDDEMTAAMRRRKSTAPTRLDLPTKLHLRHLGHCSSLPIGNREISTVDCELSSLPTISYTSIRDLLPSSPSGIMSPTSVSSQSCHDISIRNRLVKQAAWAYLQPMASSPVSSGRHLFCRIWTDYFLPPVASCLDFFNRAFRRFLGVFLCCGRAR